MFYCSPKLSESSELAFSEGGSSPKRGELLCETICHVRHNLHTTRGPGLVSHAWLLYGQTGALPEGQLL